MFFGYDEPPCVKCRFYNDCTTVSLDRRCGLCDYFEEWIEIDEDVDEDSDEYDEYLIKKGEEEYYAEWYEYQSYLEELE